MRNEGARVFMQGSTKYSTKQTWLTNTKITICIKIDTVAAHFSFDREGDRGALETLQSRRRADRGRHKILQALPKQKTSKIWFTAALLRDSFWLGKAYLFLPRFFSTNAATLKETLTKPLARLISRGCFCPAKTTPFLPRKIKQKTKISLPKIIRERIP